MHRWPSEQVAAQQLSHPQFTLTFKDGSALSEQTPTLQGMAYDAYLLQVCHLMLGFSGPGAHPCATIRASRFSETQTTSMTSNPTLQPPGAPSALEMLSSRAMRAEGTAG